MSKKKKSKYKKYIKSITKPESSPYKGFGFIEKPKRVNDYLGSERAYADETTISNDKRSIYVGDLYDMHIKGNFVKINRYITDESTLTDEEIEELLSIEEW